MQVFDFFFITSTESDSMFFCMFIQTISCGEVQLVIKFQKFSYILSVLPRLPEIFTLTGKKILIQHIYNIGYLYIYIYILVYNIYRFLNFYLSFPLNVIQCFFVYIFRLFRVVKFRELYEPKLIQKCKKLVDTQDVQFCLCLMEN